MKKIYFTILILSLICSISRAQVYVDAATGTDVAGSGSPTSPCRTIAYAVQQAATGTTINIRPGEYNETMGIYINKPLTLIKDGAGLVTINAASRSQSEQGKYMLAVVNTSNVTIDGLFFRNCIGIGSKAIWVLNDNLSTTASRNIMIRNCQVDNIGWVSDDLIQIPSGGNVAANAIKIEGGNALPVSAVTLSHNTVSNCATGYGEAITVTGNVDTFTIENNNVFRISNIGIDIAGGYDNTTAPFAVNQARNGKVTGNRVYQCMSGVAAAAGIYLDGARNIIVSHNQLFENGAGISLGGERPVAGSTGGHIVCNNLVYNNVIAGIFIGTPTMNTILPLQQTAVYNNTFFRNRTGAEVNGITTLGGASLSQAADGFGGDIMLLNTDGLDLQNNIIYPSIGKRAMVALYGYETSNFRSDYNNYYRDDSGYPLIDIGNGVISFNGSVSMGGSYTSIPAFTSVTGLESHYIPGNPGFISSATSDFRLGGSSVVLDKGGAYNSMLSGTTDFGGNPRVQGTAIDPGAYEFSGSLSINGQEQQQPAFDVFPNPAQKVLYVRLPSLSGILQLFDITGKRLRTCQVAKGSGTVSLPLDGLPAGTYWLRLTGDGGTGTRKVVVR